jgi:hypothetical protein
MWAFATEAGKPRFDRRRRGGGPLPEGALGSVLNKDSIASGVVIQGFRIEGGFDEEATLLAERRGVEAR